MHRQCTHTGKDHAHIYYIHAHLFPRQLQIATCINLAKNIEIGKPSLVEFS